MICSEASITWQGCKIDRASSDNSFSESLATLTDSALFFGAAWFGWLLKESFEPICLTTSASTRVTNLGNHSLFAKAINSTQFEDVINVENIMILRNECTAYTFNSTIRCGSVQDIPSVECHQYKCSATVDEMLMHWLQENVPLWQIFPIST